jgi:hypothetical protein
MPSTSRQKDHLKIEGFVKDKKGRKVAAIIGIKELKRIEQILEESSDFRVIRDRAAEPPGGCELYGRKRSARLRKLRGSIAVERDLTTLRRAGKR